MYKYVSIEMTINLNRMNWSRQTYSFLDWLGDLGGLFDALYYFFYLLLLPFSSFRFDSWFLNSLFRFRPSSKQQLESEDLVFNDNHHLIDALKKDLKETRVIEPIGFFSYFLCYCHRRSQHYRKLILKSHSAVTKELDL